MGYGTLNPHAKLKLLKWLCDSVNECTYARDMVQDSIHYNHYIKSRCRKKESHRLAVEQPGVWITPLDPKEKKRRKRLMTRISASQMKVLPTGWNKIQKIRATGKTKGTVDSYFISPSGQQFRSMREVERHFGSGGLSIDSGYVPQRKNKKRKVESSSSESDSDDDSDDSDDSDGSGSSEDPSSSEEDEDDSDEESEEEDSEEEESE